MKSLCTGVLIAVMPLLAQTVVSPQINTSPSREFGQPLLLPSITSTAPNLVEGRELYNPWGIAFDTSVTPPILYIADSFNNRVLAYQNPAALGVCGVSNATCGFANMSVGQRDLLSTLIGGPVGQGQGLSAGFSIPTAVAVDSSGNLYVLDAGNNRILRFPSPMKQTGALLTADLVIGQKTVGSGSNANQGSQVPTAQSLAFSNGSVYATGMAIEPATGALWVTDAINNRVLRFPASQLTAGTILPTADVVLGQNDFVTGALPNPPNGTNALLSKNILNQPTALTFDAKGRLYVAESYNRVLVFLPPFNSGTTGLAATRFLGVGVNISGQPPLSTPNNYQLGAPRGVATLNNNLFVADTAYNRIVEYDVLENWPAEPNPNQQTQTVQYSPPMLAVIGQNNQFTTGKANRGRSTPDNTTLFQPFSLAFLGTDLWVSDTSNQRVISFPQQGTSYPGATRLVGQLDFPYNTANLIEGREVNFAGQGGVVVDHNSSPPHMYIADSQNNRVLGFRDARNVVPGQKADIVIGQTDFYSSLTNSPTNDPTLPTQTGLSIPTDVLVDPAGNLYVADSGNGRVLRFPAPFNNSGSLPNANLVLGQQSYTFNITDASIQNMHTPFGLAMLSDGSLCVSDAYHNRVLIFKHASGADFSSGQSASTVLGQSNSNNITTSSANSGMSSPRHIAVDTSDRLYVADAGNNRFLVFTDALHAATGASGNPFLNFSAPQGITVSVLTGEIWVTDTNNYQVLRLPEYDQLILNSTPTSYPKTATISIQTPPIAIALDDSDNLIVDESANRVTFYYAALTYRHAANYNQQPIAPGMLTSLGRLGLGFVINNASATALPWPTALSDVQVLIKPTGTIGNGVPAPMYGIAAGIINIQVPTSIPPSGTADFLVIHPSTGEIIAAGTFPMQQYSPGFFTSGAVGSGQIAAFNVGVTDPNAVVNSPSNPVSRDGSHYISFCLTGGGVFDGGPDPAPADGNAPTGNSATHVQPVLLAASITGGIAPAGDISFSGAGCGFPGGWQVNYKVSNSFPPGPNNVVTLTISDVPAGNGPNGRIQTTFATK